MKLFSRKFGHGKPLIILHGLFGSADNWQTIAKMLAEHFEVHTLDLRNHGRSFHHDVFNYEVMMEDVAAFIKDKNLQDFSLMGHSMGGKVSMLYALNYPGQVDRLIVVDIAPRKYKVMHDWIIDALKSLDLNCCERRSDIVDVLGEKIDNYAVRQFLLKNLNRKKDGSFEWRINLEVIDRNIDKLVAEISGPHPFERSTLFIAGQKSDYIRPVDEEHILELFPKAEIIYFPKVGHWLHAQAPDLLYETVRDFLLKDQ